MEEITSFAFLIPKKTPSDLKLVGFHFYLPMGYVYSAPYFCMATKMVTDLANKSIYQSNDSGKHPLEEAANTRALGGAGKTEAQDYSSWGKLLAKQRSSAMANVDVYLDDFISVFQGGPK